MNTLIRIRYWWYRNMPWYIKFKMKLELANYYEIGQEVIINNSLYGQPSKLWTYCGNNIVVLLKR